MHAAPSLAPAARPRHTALVRVTHWITAVCFFALLLTGAAILVSHPRFYWGEAGKYLNRMTVTDDLKGFGKGVGSVSAEFGYSWYAGI